MQKNIGSADKIIRIVLGAALIAFALFGPATGYNWVGWIGVVPLVTAFVGMCPLYALLGVKTNG